MTFQDKVSQLSTLIDNAIPQLIGKKCVFLDCAYYENIGDVLIWEGTEWFLKKNHIKCVYRASKDTYRSEMVPEGIPIILQGGGNFGDLWLPHQQFRMEVIRNHPNNKIILLPQSIYYEDKTVMVKEAAEMSKHKNLTICARDVESEKLLKDNFSCQVVLLPDMAFCIPPHELIKYCVKSKGKNLFVKRRDKELSNIDYNKYLTTTFEQHDWPSYEYATKQMYHYSVLFYYCNKYKIRGLKRLPDWYAFHFLRPHYVKMGVIFLSSYEYIYTTRLHVAILSVLLNKPFTFFDNSYGKNGSFFKTWLNDVEGIRFVAR